MKAKMPLTLDEEFERFWLLNFAADRHHRYGATEKDLIRQLWIAIRCSNLGQHVAFFTKRKTNKIERNSRQKSNRN
jgi:hypothetical protein